MNKTFMILIFMVCNLCCFLLGQQFPVNNVQQDYQQSILLESRLDQASKELEDSKRTLKNVRSELSQAVQLAKSELQRETRLINSVRDFYNTSGPWSGIFFINEVNKIHLVDKENGKSEIHIRYQYTPIPNNSLRRIDTGVDQRIFFAQKLSNNDYLITDMGDAGSAVFPDEVVPDNSDPLNSF